MAAGFVEEAGKVRAAGVFAFVGAGAGAVSDLLGLEEVVAEAESVEVVSEVFFLFLDLAVSV